MQKTVLKEHFIPDTIFVFAKQGALRFYDGEKIQTLYSGECGLVRRNCLIKVLPFDGGETFEPIIFCFDEPFLREFKQKHRIKIFESNNASPIKILSTRPLLSQFLQSLAPYHQGFMSFDTAFEDLKYEELVLILLREYPELTSFLFDLRPPGKIDLETFMQRNYTFNVSLERFAWMTGRSLSSFKREFKKVFHTSPARWLINKRLEKAYELIVEKEQLPSRVYFEIGFEDLSHFSVAFKKRFGLPPSKAHLLTQE